ncbi:SNF2 family DNA or RNA helicase [Polaromonas sp. CG_9.11]|nr:SNF2 family DNA or RNA helicase [Polaromonas sp. CG_9.11]
MQWLYMLTRLGMGACLAVDMGLGDDSGAGDT